jgi:hypothetical protein
MAVGGVDRPADWPTKHPWDKLPWTGTHPYIPPRRDWRSHPPRGDQGGYLDSADNEWVPHNTNDPADFHWDVQHADGKHTNVTPEGEVQHGPDNF